MQQSEIFAVVAVFAFVGFILWLFSAQARAKIRYRAEIQKELIGKFSSARELSEFLNSDAGKLLIHEPKDGEGGRAGKEAPPKSAKQQVLEGIGFGILGLAVGAAILITRGLTLSGAVFTALGIGFLTNALVGYLLVKKWGFWEQPPGSNAPKTNVS